MMLCAGLLCYLGFTLLCLAMDRHHQDLLGQKLSAGRRRRLRLVAAIVLGAALGLLVSTAGWAMGLVRGLGLAMASAGLLVWLLPYQPRLAMGLALLASPTALAVRLSL